MLEVSKKGHRPSWQAPGGWDPMLVEVYILAWRGPSQCVYAIERSLMQQYLDGDLTTDELAHQIVITGI